MTERTENEKTRTGNEMANLGRALAVLERLSREACGGKGGRDPVRFLEFEYVRNGIRDMMTDEAWVAYIGAQRDRRAATRLAERLAG